MHELSLVSHIAQTALEVAEREGASEVLLVQLHLGPLSCARRESLERVWPLVAREGALLGAKIEIELTPLVLRCGRCEAETKNMQPILQCAHCGAEDVEILSGRDLLIAAMEVR